MVLPGGDENLIIAGIAVAESIKKSATPLMGQRS
jgi:hypothetical protein